VKLLLERKEVNPGSTDEYGETPLSEATMNGHEGVVKLLLEGRAASPDSSNNWVETPLPSAAGNGHENIAKLLPEHNEASHSSSDNGVQTPLSMAARNSHEDVPLKGIRKFRLRLPCICPIGSTGRINKTKKRNPKK